MSHIKGKIVIDADAVTARRYCPQHGVACVVELTDTSCVIVFNTAYNADRAKILRHENGTAKVGQRITVTDDE